MTVTAARNASRIYKARRGVSEVRALSEFSLAINPGDYLALLGPNGAGKSTLLRLLAGLDSPDTGTVETVSRADLAVVFQKPALDPLLTIRENLSLQAALHGLSDRVAVGTDSAAKLGLSDRLDSRVSTLSGGLARRADLARALLTKPALLLLDEPTTGLDHQARADFLDALDAQRAEHPDLTIIMSTHLMDEAARATRVALISNGELIADDAPSNLRTAHSVANILTTDADSEPFLQSYRLTLTHHAQSISATGDPDAVAAAAEALLRASISFSIAPPTLGDVYLAKTGSSLTGVSP